MIKSRQCCRTRLSCTESTDLVTVPTAARVHEFWPSKIVSQSYIDYRKLGLKKVTWKEWWKLVRLKAGMMMGAE